MARQSTPRSPAARELTALFAVIDDHDLLATLQAIRWTGRPGWSLQALWHAYLATYHLNIPTTAELIRRLEDSPDLRSVCGFRADLPSRWTFGRFYARLATHRDLVEHCLAGLTSELAARLPGFGAQVTIDASTVRTHSNPDQPVVSDPEASWTAKKGTQGKKIWHFGYKLHLLADVTYELPISFTVTTAKRQDVQEFVPVLDRARLCFHWFHPEAVSADKGYDADANYAAVKALGAIPTIKAKTLRKNFAVDDLAVPRDSAAWTAIYNQRPAVERCFARLKGYRTLNTHCRRGLAKVALHCAMSVLALQATAVVAARDGRIDAVTACTRKVA